jgi:hypothetical protein
MITVLNLFVVGLAALIAYWWANQGAFSALLHLVCVAVAAAMAFALWEPAALALAGTGLQDYALGISLLGLFALFLIVLRIAADRLVPANLNFQPAVNYLVGGVFGAAAGVLTMGMVLLGAGLLQHKSDLLGYGGWQRTSQSFGQPARPSGGLWLPMHEWVAGGYAVLSSNALAPELSAVSLRNRQPHLDRLAMGLLRDSFRDGQSKIGLSPAHVTLLGTLTAKGMPLPQTMGGPQGVFAVGLEFSQGAYDFGERLTLSASQVRLIADAPPTRAAATAHPFAWAAELPGGVRSFFPFDDRSHYVTNIPGQQSTTAWLLFKESDLQGQQPRFIQVKGLRIRLPQIEALPPMDAIARIMGGTAGQRPEFNPRLPTVGGNDIAVNNRIDPVQASYNELAGMQETDRWLTAGRGTFPSSAQRRVSRELQIRGIFEPEGTKVVRLNVSRGRSPVNIWDSPARREAGENAPVLLVDVDGRTYSPFGYFWIRRNDGEVDIVLDPVRGIPRVGDLPAMSSAGVDELYAIYRITEGVQIKAVRLGEVPIANVDLVVESRRSP